MRVAHTGASAPSASLEDDVVAAARIGADGLEVWAPKLIAPFLALVRQLGADAPAVVPGPPRDPGDPVGWTRHLGERALAAERDSRLSRTA